MQYLYRYKKTTTAIFDLIFNTDTGGTGINSTTYFKIHDTCMCVCVCVCTGTVATRVPVFYCIKKH